MSKKLKMQRPHIGRCVVLCESLPAAIIMYRLMVWNPTIKIGGKLWFAKSHESLMFETGLSLKQVKTGVAQNRNCQYIETTLREFHGKRTNHYRVTDTFRQMFEHVETVKKTLTQQPGEVFALDHPELMNKLMTDGFLLFEDELS